jgi:predicted branched-subunit amino acid permease
VAEEHDGRAVLKRVLTDGLAIVLSLFAFGMVFGLAARQADFSMVEALAMSLIAYSGAAQFAAVGLVASGVPWLGIVLLTALLNARHVLYAASLAPWFVRTPRRRRAIAAHFLTDEVLALTMPGIRALGRLDLRSYALAAVLTITPWVTATPRGGPRVHRQRPWGGSRTRAPDAEESWRHPLEPIVDTQMCRVEAPTYVGFGHPTAKWRLVRGLRCRAWPL